MKSQRPKLSNKRMPRKIIIAIAIVLVAGFGGTIFTLQARRHAPQSANNTTQASNKAQQPETPAASTKITMVASGDQIAHDSLVAFAQKGDTYDFSPLYSNISAQLQNKDIVFCNPETLIAGKAYGISGYPSFNAPTEFARDMVNSGKCNLINQATNHLNDKGQAAINANLDTWDALKPLAAAGANRSTEEQNTVHYFTVKGITFAFLAFADFSNNTNLTSYGINIYHNTALFDQQITAARAKADVVVLSMHWGTEDSTAVNTDQKDFAQRAANLGVDVLIGTGPHVLQQATYTPGTNGKQMLTWYSLGNLLSTQLQVNELTGGIASWTFTKTENSGIKIEDVHFYPTFMSYSWPAADKAANNLMARTNLKLQPLAAAGNEISAMFPSSGASERLQFVTDTLGSSANVTISN